MSERGVLIQAAETVFVFLSSLYVTSCHRYAVTQPEVWSIIASVLYEKTRDHVEYG